MRPHRHRPRADRPSQHVLGHASLLAVILALLVPGVALAAPASSRAVLGVHYARITPACPAPTATRPSCLALVRRPATRADANTSYVAHHAYAVGPAGGYTPADLQAAYGVSALSATAGAGQTIAIVDAHGDSQIASDLATFDAEYGLPSCGAGCLNVYNEQGQAAPLPADDTGWAMEISLDVEAVHSICELCTIDLVEASDSDDVDLGQAENEAVKLGADEVTNSFGGPESSLNTTAADYDHPGVAIFASGGDQGYEDWDDSDFGNPGVPNMPASLPTVIAVGGTTLNLNDDGTRSLETVWNDDDGMQDAAGSGGGGCSSLFSAGPWQTAVPDWNATGCGTHRLADDVSADADPDTGFDVYDSVGGGWATIGGTSLSSPLMAAMMALAGGPGGIDDPARTLYASLSTTPSAFYDVTVGGNGQCDGAYDAGDCADGSSFDSTTDCDATLACNAGTGYDGPTGVGTPNGIAGLIAPSPTAAIAGPASLTSGASGSFSASGSTAPPGALTTDSWNFGDGGTGSGASVAHAYAAPGTYTVTLTVSDGGVRSATASVMVTVTAPPAPAPPAARAVAPGTLTRGRVHQRGSSVNVALGCTGAAGASCAGTVSIVERTSVRVHGRRRQRTVVLVAHPVSLSAGATAAVRLALPSAIRRRLARSGLAVTLILTDAGGSRASALHLARVTAHRRR